MGNILTMTEEELIAYINHRDEGKTTVTYANGMTTEMSQEEVISRKQELILRGADF